jgi:NADH-quinone oxidoreductase subunit L
VFDALALLKLLCLLVPGAPLVLLVFFGLVALLGKSLSEAVIGGALRATLLTGFVASVVIGALMLALGLRQFPIAVGDWVITPHYHFKIEFIFDPLSLPYIGLTYLLCGTIGAFSTRYLHREKGYARFFVLFALFLQGMTVAALADTIETLFVGWELVGLSSVLLIAFFHERRAPAQNGFRVWIVYRISDAALMLATVFMHELIGEGDFDRLVGSAPWPWHQPLPATQHSMLLGVLFLIAAIGKSALVPLSGWLPRAMEGPTPSSAVFYGALSVHLGAFLLLRISPVIDSLPVLAALVVVTGALTALYAYVVGSVQTDIKSSLSFAALLQVGIIVAEIGLGFRHLALIHLIGHACLRTLQFVRAPTLLHDNHTLENAIGSRLPARPGFLPRVLPASLYRAALERGFLDITLSERVLGPLARGARALESLERRWLDLLSEKRKP